MALAATACELTSSSIAVPEDALLVEAHITWIDGFTNTATARVFIHGTTGSAQSLTGPPDATVTITGEGGGAAVLTEQPVVECVLETVPSRDPGRCYTGPLTTDVRPGTTAQLLIEAVGGAVITGVTHVPENFEMLSPVAAGRTCRLPANTRTTIAWSVSPGAWAYPAEVRFEGLGSLLAARDAEFENLDDPLILFGLAISDADTTISYPNEFGLFDRFDDDLLIRALVEVQDGLPDGTRSRVTVAAADRNFVNWERGGNFNPSGPVRVPSVSGDGFGVFGSMVLKTIGIEIGEPGDGRSACAVTN